MKAYRLSLIVLLLAADRGLAQQKAANDVAFDVPAAKHILSSYLTDLDTIHAKIIALANAIPADKYSWRPAAGVRSVSEVLMHVATEYYFWGPRSVGGNPPADFGNPRETIPALEKKFTEKSAVLAELDKAWAHGRAQIAGIDPAGLTSAYKPWNVTLDAAAFGMTGDLHEHLGQLIAYARSIGVVPPWSK